MDKNSSKKKSFLKIIWGVIFFLLPNFFIFIPNIFILGIYGTNILLMLVTPLAILGIILVIWGIYGLLKKNDIKTDDTEMKNRSTPNIFRILIVIVVVLFGVNGIVSLRMYKDSKEDRKNEYVRLYKENNDQIEKQYQKIYEMLQGPQKVVGVESYGALKLENNVIVHYEDSEIKGDERAEIFTNYARENLIGKTINVIMPPKDLFILYLSHFPDSFHIYAIVLFNNESMNEKFGLQNPEKVYRIMFQ